MYPKMPLSTNYIIEALSFGSPNMACRKTFERGASLTYLVGNVKFDIFEHWSWEVPCNLAIKEPKGEW